VPPIEPSFASRDRLGFSAEANAQASRGVLVVDLMCDARSYMPQNYSSDGFHPSDRAMRSWPKRC